METYGASYRSVAFGTWKVGEARRFTAERFAKRHRTPDPIKDTINCQQDKWVYHYHVWLYYSFFAIYNMHVTITMEKSKVRTHSLNIKNRNQMLCEFFFWPTGILFWNLSFCCDEIIKECFWTNCSFSSLFFDFIDLPICVSNMLFCYLNKKMPSFFVWMTNMACVTLSSSLLICKLMFVCAHGHFEPVLFLL